LESIASDLRLSDGTVRFLGNLPDLSPVYQRSDMLVLTSDFEGTPNVVLEAMACGIPVIATNVGDAADLVRDGETGFITGLTVEEIASRVAELVTNPARARAMGERGRELAESTYSVQRLPDYLTGLYGAALA
jgi:glycosyltransferase involved in cell wall biosynthesis